MICWWSAITIGQTVYSTAWFKVTKRNSEIGKVVRGATDLRYSVCPGAHILNCRKLNFWFRYTNFAGTFRFRRVFDHTSHSYRDLEAVRFWTIFPSLKKAKGLKMNECFSLIVGAPRSRRTPGTTRRSSWWATSATWRTSASSPSSGESSWPTRSASSSTRRRPRKTSMSE